MEQISPIDRRIFTGVMDADSSHHAIAEGDYIDLINGMNGVTTDKGAITNVQGSVLIANDLPPTGRHKTIMALEDNENDTIVFGVWNSEGFHGIYRWFRNRQGYSNGIIETVFLVKNPQLYTPFNPNPLDFKEDKLITGAFISGNYLFLTDDNSRSKVIDLSRANENNKRREFNLYFNPVVFGQTINYSLSLYKAGAGLLAQLSWTSSGNDYKTNIENLISEYRTSTFGRFVTLSACENYVGAVMASDGEYYLVFDGDSQYAPSSVPQNFYPDYNASVPSYSPASLSLFDRLTYTSYREPYAQYLTDTNTNFNFVKDKVFQFRIKYRYFDDSESVYGAISINPIPQQSCNPNNYSNTNNYIRIDFTDERLFNPSTASIIKEVEIAVIQPAISSQWVTVKRLQQYEFIPIGTQYFNFYNNTTTEPIAQTETDKPFDNLFIKHKSDVFIDNRSFPSGGTMGYDSPCVKMEAEVEYLNPVTSIQRYSVSGTTFIENLWYDGSQNPAFQNQIFWKPLQSTGQSAFLGGIRGINIVPIGVQAFPGNLAAYEQEVPFGGIIAYLAGTNYYAIGRHPIITQNSYSFLSGVTIPPQDSNGIFLFDISSASARKDMYNFLNAFWQNQTQIPINYTINNVPNGKYVLRFASHKLTANELSQSTAQWQKTSTNVFQYFGAVKNFSEFETEVTVNNANVSVTAAMGIADLCDPTGGGASMTGYIVANDNPNFSNSLADFKAETRVDRAIARCGRSNNSSFSSAISCTDHNGYFYDTDNLLVGSGNDLTVLLLFSGSNSASITQSIQSNGTAWTPVPQGQSKEGYFRITDNTIKTIGRTFISGVIQDGNSEPQAGIAVVGTKGEWDYTDINGQYTLTVYAETPDDIRSGKLIPNAPGISCQYSFIPFERLYSMFIGQANYNEVNTLTGEGFLASIINTVQSISSWKRGSSRYLGIVYADEGDRKTAVVPMNEPVNILFYTEKDALGNIPAQGAANIQVSIYNEPPEWAVKYYLVAMQDQMASGHLQWTMNNVEYIDATGTVNIQSAVKVKINIDNIGFYTNNLYPQATIAFSFQKGDRIRIKKAAAFSSGVRYLDYEIIETDNNNIYIPVDNSIVFEKGDIFEAYTPRTQDQTRIFYELGTYEIQSAVINGVLKKYHIGNIANQFYLPYPNASVTPAVIKLTKGDVYYRLRNMPYNYDISNPSSLPLYVNDYISDDSVSDFYSSRVIGWGRPNTDNLPEQREMGSTTIISNPYNRNTLKNGLRSFEPLNEKQFPVAFGKINKCVLVSNTVMKLIFSNSYIVSIYVNQDILRVSSGNQNLVAISDDVLPRAYAMQRQFGTINPESIVVNDKGDVYGWDAKTSVVWQDTGQGLIPVSEFKQNTTFNKIGNDINALGNYSESIGWYDKLNDFYVITYRPVLAASEVKSKAVISAMDSTFGTLPNPTLIQLRINPLNLILVSTIFNTNPYFPDISTVIINGVNSFGNGWSAYQDEYGNAIIESPDGSSVYQNQVAVLSYSSAGFYKEFSYIMKNGKPQGRGVDFSGKTMVYCDAKKGWTQRYDFGVNPEMYGTLKTESCYFHEGQFWLLGDETNYNNFSNNQQIRKLKAVFNQNWTKSKIYEFLEVHTDTELYCPEITVPPYEDNPSGMITELTKQHFKQVLGKYWSKLTRDKNTPDVLMTNAGITPTPDNKWTNGREMKGYVAIVDIENDTNRKAPLIEAHLGYIFAEKS